MSYKATQIANTFIDCNDMFASTINVPSFIIRGCKCGPGSVPVRMCSHGYRRSALHYEFCTVCDAPKTQDLPVPAMSLARPAAAPQPARPRKRQRAPEAIRLYMHSSTFKDWTDRKTSLAECTAIGNYMSSSTFNE